jgi:hypothetical protein
MHLRTTVLLCLVQLGCQTADPNAPLTGPEHLSDTGLYADFAARRLTDGLIPLVPRYPLWSDGAEKSRYLLLPKGGRIDTHDMNDWRFPVGTKVWKEFKLDGRLVETRLLEKRREPDEGGWFQMSYVWTDDESDALATPDGVKGAHGTTYEVPAQKDCGSCHYKGEKPTIGISAIQLSTRADGGEPTITSLTAGGALSDPPTGTFTPPGQGVVRDALGYLFGNCSYCHDSRSAAAADVKVFMNLSVTDAAPEDTQAYKTLVGQPIHHFPDVGLGGLVVPGMPDKSLVYYRMDRRDAAQMPPIITHQVDDAGVATIAAWITGLLTP